jgi:hypothetical protein
MTASAPSLMPASQIVHVEEVALDSHNYTVCVVRVAGGLAGQWHCACGTVHALSTTHVSVGNAVQEARRSLAEHHQCEHAVAAQP